MMAVILAAGTQPADSTTFSVSAGQEVVVSLLPPVAGDWDGAASVQIMRETTAGFIAVGRLETIPAENRAVVVTAPGTYKAKRILQEHSVGVETT